MFLREDLALRGFDVIAMEQTVQVIASPGTHLDQTTTVCHERTQLTYFDGRNPDFGDEIGGEEMSQAEDVMPIGLDAGFSDPFYLRWMSDYHSRHQGRYLIIYLPGVGCGFDDGDVGV
jgi:hypothetical protein